MPVFAFRGVIDKVVIKKYEKHQDIERVGNFSVGKQQDYLGSFRNLQRSNIRNIKN